MTARSDPRSLNIRLFAVPVEVVIYGLLLAAGAALRLAHIGDTPLNGAETGNALAALSVLRPALANAGAISSPLIVSGAALIMTLTGATNAAVRLLPALGGMALVCMPLAFRRRLGQIPTLVMVAWLALSPVAVFASRRAGGSGLAMLAMLAALAAADRYLTYQATRRRWAPLVFGAALAVAWLADGAAFLIVIGVALGWLFALVTDEEGAITPGGLRGAARAVPWLTAAAGFAATLAGISTLYFAVPGGLGIAADQLTRFLTGFVRTTPGAASPLLVLAFYEPLLLALGITGAWQAAPSATPWKRFVAGWALAASLLLLLYRGGQPEHALWAVVPFAALAGLAAERIADARHSAPSWGVAIHVVTNIALLAMTFAALTHHLTAPRLFAVPQNALTGPFDIPLDLILVALWIVLIVIVWLTVASLWDERAAWKAAGLSALIVAVPLACGQSASLAFTRPASPYEPLNTAPTQPGIERLLATAHDLSDLTYGYKDTAATVVQPDASDLLVWTFRDYEGAAFDPSPGSATSTPMIVTPLIEGNPAFGADYVGQDFVIVRQWSPAGLDAAGLLKWWIYRSAPTPPEEARAVLWVREDIYRLVGAGGAPD
jgi:hypothetical protein